MRKRKPRRRMRWLAYILVAVAAWVGAELVFDSFPEEKKQFRENLRTSVHNAFPEQAAEVAKSFGLRVYQQESESPLTPDASASSVVLVHGLDDPGKVWMNLAPLLVDEGMHVLELRYPNDQPARSSAWLFYKELRRLAPLGVQHVAVVAHSMGGLVSREMLTNPEIAFQVKAGESQVPQVTDLIMVGTPNHGSELARFRILSEVRDQWGHLLKGQGHLLRGILDGAGEAKIDLLPDSRFLTTLNGRPHPKGVRMLSIAGMASPWTDRDVEHLLDSVRDHVPAAKQESLNELGAFLRSMTHDLGDGLVTVESTRLDGVDHRIVAGTHLTMIRNLTAADPRIPPAVPVVIEALGRPPSP
ncbi:MAG: acetyltransferase [Gammaproteobacteria bacterium]|nr:acetyltransferase [Gammaproteobacteria bacterium]